MQKKRILRSKVDQLEFISWKHEVAMHIAGWLSKGLETQDPGYLEWAEYKECHVMAAKAVAEVFTHGGEAGTCLAFCQEVDGPVIVANSIFPDIDDRPNTVVDPREILMRIEEKLNALAKNSFQEGIFKVCRHNIIAMRHRWFCDHNWIDSMYPEQGEGYRVEIEYCTICGTEREKWMS